MRESISSVFASPEGGGEFLPVDDESGECVPEFAALASLDGCGAASSAAALIAKAAAKDNISVKETNLSFSRSFIIISRSLCRLRLLGAAGAILVTKEHDLNRRYNNQQDDRTDEHSADDDGCERLLYLAADAG
jgi:hypothetical protein